MSLNISKCVITPMIIKACCQQSINDSKSKGCDYEAKSRKKLSQRGPGFRIHGSGGGDGDGAKNLEEERNKDEIRSKGTQTDYRESETQTSPWEAPYKLRLRKNENPEVLNLANSTWGNGLPAGMHEVQIINRMRMKKAWLEVLPPMDTPSNIKTCETIMSAIEANEWAFREAEIQFIMDSRMTLMEEITKERMRVKGEQADQRMERLAKRLGQQRDKQIRNIRGTFFRDVRKLNRKHRGSSAPSYKIHRSDIIARYANPASDIYAPEMRFGFKSDGRHEILDKTLLPETYVDQAIRVNDSSKWLPTDEELKELRKISRPEELCFRRTRWTDEKLRKLHADLKSIRLNDTRNERRERLSLLKRKFKVPPLPVTPLRRGVDDNDDNWEKSSLFIQKITRGRAVQCMMFEGRNRCRELIEELRSTHSLQDSKEDSHDEEMNIIMEKTREQNERLMRENRLCEILDSLEGMTVSGMLDMLSKEEIRLREERKVHALSLLVERERNRREAEEAGRRQYERNRRRELDEMFRQMVKVNQDTVEVYLEDIIKEGIDWISENEARKYVEELANKIEASTSKSAHQETDKIQDETIVSDMVHNFLLPEVDKHITRKKIRERQQEYIHEAHRSIYNEIMNLKSEEKLKDNEISEKPSNDMSEAEENAEDEITSEEDVEIYNEIMKLSSTETLQDSSEFFKISDAPKQPTELSSDEENH